MMWCNPSCGASRPKGKAFVDFSLSSDIMYEKVDNDVAVIRLSLIGENNV